jgi:hypothetical protein
VELVELIYKHFVQGLFKRARARETIRKKLLYKGWACSENHQYGAWATQIEIGGL